MYIVECKCLLVQVEFLFYKREPKDKKCYVINFEFSWVAQKTVFSKTEIRQQWAIQLEIEYDLSRLAISILLFILCFQK